MNRLRSLPCFKRRTADSSPTSSVTEESPLIENEEDEVGGGKDISFWGGLALLTNSITGPGIVTLPVLMQQAGWFTPILAMAVVGVTSGLSATMLCKAIEKCKGNKNFVGRVEFSGVAKEFFPKWGFIITMILLVLSLMAMLISSVVISAQTMDLALLAVFKRSYGVEFYPHPFTIAEVTKPGEGVSPFGNDYVLSLGYVIVLLLTIPMGLFNLEDNIIIQNGALIFLILIFTEWFVNCFKLGFHFDRTPFVAKKQADVLGNIIFNYAFVTTVPSWVNEKRPSVSINKSIWSATGISTAFYVSIGLLGAWSFRYSGTQDLLDVIDEQSTGVLHTISMVCVYVFPVVAFLSSIPVFSIIIKYNLIEHKLCNKTLSNFWAVIFPWVLSIVFYSGSGFENVINWTSLCINGFINFVIPMVLYILAIRREKKEGNLQDDGEDGEEIEAEEEHFQVLPKSRFIHPTCIALSSAVLMTILCVAVIVINIVTGQS